MLSATGLHHAWVPTAPITPSSQRPEGMGCLAPQCFPPAVPGQSGGLTGPSLWPRSLCTCLAWLPDPCVTAPTFVLGRSPPGAPVSTPDLAHTCPDPWFSKVRLAQLAALPYSLLSKNSSPTSCANVSQTSAFPFCDVLIYNKKYVFGLGFVFLA